MRETLDETPNSLVPAEDWGVARFGGDLLCYISGHWWKIVLPDGSFLRASQAGLKTYQGEPVGVNAWGVLMDPVMTFKTSEAAFLARDKAYHLYRKQHCKLSCKAHRQGQNGTGGAA